MLANLLTYPYQLVVRSRLWLYQQGLKKSKRLPRPVVSVGNLTVGGTGKTPMTMWVSRYLAATGKRVAILSRGYRRQSGKPFLLVSNGNDILTGPKEAGDEPFLMATRCPGIVVAVGANRYELGRWVLEQHDVDCFVLDDGFQHLNLERDLNLLLVDVSDVSSLKSLLPLGKLREPISGARRASEIIFTRAERQEDTESVRQLLESALGESIVPITSRFHGTGILCGGSDVVHDPFWLQGKRVCLFSGIANAGSFRHLVERLEAQVVEELIYPDHMAYTLETLEEIQQRALQAQSQVLLTTEKDIVKVIPIWPYADPVWVMSLGLQFLDGQDRLEHQLCSL
ncbi:tetraacyldisaccharide 4'-kinase [Candidatus Nitronereus thalassa]|uniref:Tetraacyldisaccharide 4'-kinase n=1 Tax=Candidatus Nitronereus thalassa TaxID=3020898 RepID=A0ABU3K647_9BACT|nr:tetraacyldisaccharide 4'-kinase [Candidatus Nitronereus thalassa]MDT7041813.1 tetraacyldisaccharide 4'-kinase [Candidatus Nitronereus thalassa]